jgi:hypothetical protein
MRGLYRRPDRAETRFLINWIIAWLLGLALFILSEEATVFLHGLAGDSSDLVELGEIANLFIYVIATVAGLLLPWLTLSPLYQRPGFGAWLGWMILSLVILIVIFIIAAAVLIALSDAPTGAAYKPGPAFYIFAGLVIIASMSGYVLAFLTLAWRVGFAVTIAIIGTSTVLVATDLSSVSLGLLESLQTPDDLEDWGEGMEWSELPLLLAETLIMGAATGVALVIGYRWHERDVESRIFD